MNNNIIITSPKASIVMPVYNTDKYVKEALMSIIDQTLKEIEIIVINDGSTDNSLQVVTELAEKDNRIKIYSQKNQGQSVARNLGINKAEGEYIYFMDSDDFLDPEALECCYNKCVKENLDFIFFDADIICENKELTLAFDYHRTEIKEIVYKGIDLISELIDRNLYRPAPWMSFIRLSYLQRINLNFYPGIIHEDELFSAILYIEAERVGRIGKDFFKRRIRGNSTMTKQFSWENIEGYFTVIIQLKEYSKGKSANTKNVMLKYIRIMLNIIIQKAYRLSFKEKARIIFCCIKQNNITLLKIKTIVIFLFKSQLKKHVNA